MARAWGVMSKSAMAVAVLLALLAASVPRGNALEVETVATLADGAEPEELVSTAARIVQDIANPNSVAGRVAAMLKAARKTVLEAPQTEKKSMFEKFTALLNSTPKPKESVLIVGAGPAGLLSALQAYTAGYEKITVIEGRDWDTPSRHHVLKNIGKRSLPHALMAAAGLNSLADTTLDGLWTRWETTLSRPDVGGDVLKALRRILPTQSRRETAAVRAMAFYSEYMAGMRPGVDFTSHAFTSINVFEASMRAFVKGLDTDVITTHGGHYFHGVCPVPGDVQGLPAGFKGKHVAVTFGKAHVAEFKCGTAKFTYDTTKGLTVQDEDKESASTFLADVIIGADGAWSTVRFHAWKDEVDFYVPNERVGDKTTEDWFPHFVKAVFKVNDDVLEDEYGLLTSCGYDTKRVHMVQPEVLTPAGTVPADVIDGSFFDVYRFDKVVGLFSRYSAGQHGLINAVFGKVNPTETFPLGLSAREMRRAVFSLTMDLNEALQQCNANINLTNADLMDVGTTGKKELFGFAMPIYHVNEPVKTVGGITYLLVGDSQMTSNFKQGASVTEVARTMYTLWGELRRQRTNTSGKPIFSGALEWEKLLCRYTNNNGTPCMEDPKTPLDEKKKFKAVTTERTLKFRSLNLSK